MEPGGDHDTSEDALIGRHGGGARRRAGGGQAAAGAKAGHAGGRGLDHPLAQARLGADLRPRPGRDGRLDRRDPDSASLYRPARQRHLGGGFHRQAAARLRPAGGDPDPCSPRPPRRRRRPRSCFARRYDFRAARRGRAGHRPGRRRLPSADPSRDAERRPDPAHLRDEPGHGRLPDERVADRGASRAGQPRQGGVGGAAQDGCGDGDRRDG
jgi:hypothetical protein